jgi:hypothetical protein
MKHPGLTFYDLQYHLIQLEDKCAIPTLDVTLYTVNGKSGELTIIEPGNAHYVANPKPGHFCLISTPNTRKFFNLPMFYVHENSRDDSWMTGFIASNYILFLNKDDAKKLSMNILRKKKKELEAKMNRVKNL